MSDEQKRILERELWNIADLLRGKMNADEYKKRHTKNFVSMILEQILFIHQLHVQVS